MPGTTAIRAHGDEFFLVGTGGTPDWVGLVAAVDALRVQAADGRWMRCAVSVGWCTDRDGPRTPDALRARLEAACALAKWAESRVVRAVEGLVPPPPLRTLDCPACGARTEVRQPPGSGPVVLTCPVCGGSGCPASVRRR